MSSTPAVPAVVSVDPDLDRERDDRESNLKSTILQVMSEALPTLLAAAQASASANNSQPLPSVEPATNLSPAPSMPAPPTLSPSMGATLPSPASATHRLPAANIPQRTLDRIMAGEFINLSELLTTSMACTTQPLTNMQFELRDGQPHLVEGTVTSPKTRRVHDIATWLEGYTVYMHTILQAAPHRLNQLLGYQSLIIEANRRFTPEGWLDYDQQFRQMAARDASLPWDAIHATLWQLTTTGKARPTCPSCQMVHPPAPSGSCPFRPPSASANTSHNSGLFQGKQICKNFNNNRCSGSCTRAHVCFRCRGRHPISGCKQRPGAASSGKSH